MLRFLHQNFTFQILSNFFIHCIFYEPLLMHQSQHKKSKGQQNKNFSNRYSVRSAYYLNTAFSIDKKLINTFLRIGYHQTEIAKNIGVDQFSI